MKVLILNGNTKSGGFIAGCLEGIEARLKEKGVETELIRLADARIEDCVGCMTCLKTGVCPIEDDLGGIIDKMDACSGIVVGAPVRNGLTTATYKRFYDRITYIVGFALKLENKYTLAISSVGLAGGKSVNKKFLGLQRVFHSRLSNYLFFKVGFPTKITADDIRSQLEAAADKLASDIETKAPRGTMDKLSFAVDRLVIRKMMLEKQPDFFAYIMDSWRTKGYL